MGASQGRCLVIKEEYLREMLEVFASTGDEPELDVMRARSILIVGPGRKGC